MTKTVGDGVASGAATLSNKVQTIDTEDLSKKVQDGWTNFGGWMSTMAEKTVINTHYCCCFFCQQNISLQLNVKR